MRFVRQPGPLVTGRDVFVPKLFHVRRAPSKLSEACTGNGPALTSSRFLIIDLIAATRGRIDRGIFSGTLTVALLAFEREERNGDSFTSLQAVARRVLIGSDTRVYRVYRLVRSECAAGFGAGVSGDHQLLLCRIRPSDWRYVLCRHLKWRQFITRRAVLTGARRICGTGLTDGRATPRSRGCFVAGSAA